MNMNQFAYYYFNIWLHCYQFKLFLLEIFLMCILLDFSANLFFSVFGIFLEGTCSAMVIIIGSGNGYPSSNPKRGCWHFT